MNYIVRPPSDPNLFGRRQDDLDGLLRAFYREELPDPWPMLKPPSPSPSKPSKAAGSGSKPSLFRSRFALAATIALCLIGSLGLCGRFAASPSAQPRGTSRDIGERPGRNQHRNQFIIRNEQRGQTPEGRPFIRLQVDSPK